MAALSHLFSLSLLCFSLAAQALNNPDPKCSATNDHGSNLQVFHVYSPCSPFRPSQPLSWEEDVLQSLAKDQARLQFLDSLAGVKKSIVPIASGRQIIQSPTYIVRANIGTPPQTMLMAVDTSSDTAWVPCNGCVGCSSNVFNSLKSTTFKSLNCGAAQCKQVIYQFRPTLLYGLMIILIFLYSLAHHNHTLALFDTTRSLKVDHLLLSNYIMRGQ